MDNLYQSIAVLKKISLLIAKRSSVSEMISQMLDILGLVESDKSAIISFIREDMVKSALETLNEKFIKVKNGKGVAYTIPLDSIIGVSNYQLLSNDKTVKMGVKNNEKGL